MQAVRHGEAEHVAGCSKSMSQTRFYAVGAVVRPRSRVFEAERHEERADWFEMIYSPR